MGPVALFDKSFLQSLNVDEAVWFDRFYIPLICPLFYVETLADLNKKMKAGNSSEEVVGRLAEKAPQLSGAPNVHHHELLLANLLGQSICLGNRPQVAGGRASKSQGRNGVTFDVSPEAKAFSRWQAGEFQQLEREFAKFWRAHVKAMSFESSAEYTRKLGINILECKNMRDAANVSSQIVRKSEKPYDLIEFIVRAIGVPSEYLQRIVQRYQACGFPPINQYAPYVAHVLRVEIFFHICVSRGFISADRPSNKIDIEYLHYLPFCHIFVSSDKLHQTTSELFLADNQRFIWGQDLKADLSKLDKHYSEFPQEVKDRGIMSFAARPPAEGQFLTSELWDFAGLIWRRPEWNFSAPSDEITKEIADFVNGFTENSSSWDSDAQESSDDLDGLCINRSISERRGSWHQLPKNGKDG